jgi:nucleotide-binding universal stress UspA family protein
MIILLAVDGSPCSDVAIAETARLPLPAEATVYVVTVDDPEYPPRRADMPPTAFDASMDNFRRAAKMRLAAAADRLRQLVPHLNVVPRLLEGCPKDAIVAEAERCGADLIVVGSHGYGPIRRFFLGSVSLFVAHHAPCSVLIARCRPENCPDAAASATT